MRVFFDSEGQFYLNNVRVNGILTDSAETGWFLLGVLNSRPVDFVFRRIAKPKDGGYFEANKQFIAPLPVPKADKKERKKVADLAKKLQKLRTGKREKPQPRLKAKIDEAERELDRRIYSLFGLDKSDIRLVEADGG